MGSKSQDRVLIGRSRGVLLDDEEQQPSLVSKICDSKTVAGKMIDVATSDVAARDKGRGRRGILRRVA